MRRLICICLCLFAVSYAVHARDVEKKVEEILKQMTLEEKVALCHGNSKMTVAGVPRLGVPEITMSDGPHGVHEDRMRNRMRVAGKDDDHSTYLPTGTALAATWNRDMAKLHGRVMGREARDRKKDILLGPMINMLRTPLNGRNFECMSEDPYLMGSIVAVQVPEIQKQDVAACLKSYACYNQGLNQGGVDHHPDERTLREIYLPAFRMGVIEGGALTVMSAYSHFRGDQSAQSAHLLNTVLKGDWGFKGLVMTDWGCKINTRDAALNGLDVEMGTQASYEDYHLANPFLEELKKGTIPISVVDDKARRVLRVALTIGVDDSDRVKGSRNTKENQAAVLKIAQEAIVLLKNDGILPLDAKKIKRLLVTGPNANVEHGHGGRSAKVKSLYEITPLEGLQKKVGDKIEIITLPNSKIEELTKAAKEADAVIYVAGLDHRNGNETEGRDRKHMNLMGNQDEEIACVLENNPHTVILMIAGSPVTMPWLDKAPCLVWGWYNGQEGGHAMADVIFGDVNPSGKMPFTCPKKLEDWPCHALDDYKEDILKYPEGVFNGYRWFDKKNVEPLFPFGFGLSYTTFKYDDLKVGTGAGDVVATASVKITNTGKREGAEIVQLYVGDPECKVERPPKELKGFDKVALKPGESKEVSFELKRQDLSFWDEDSSGWLAEPGKFEVMIGSSSRDICVKDSFELKE